MQLPRQKSIIFWKAHFREKQEENFHPHNASIRKQTAISVQNMFQPTAKRKERSLAKNKKKKKLIFLPTAKFVQHPSYTAQTFFESGFSKTGPQKLNRNLTPWTVRWRVPNRNSLSFHSFWNIGISFVLIQKVFCNGFYLCEYFCIMR